MALEGPQGIVKALRMEPNDSEPGMGRRLLKGTIDTSNPTFKWAMVAIGCTVGAILLVIIIFIVWTKCFRSKSSKVAAVPLNNAGGMQDPAGFKPDMMQRSAPQQQFMQGGQMNSPMMGNTPPYGSPDPMMALPGGMTPGYSPVPPWEQYGQPPPGIMLATSIPTNFTPFTSNPRPPNAPPYERLVLVSSRVHQPMRVASAVLPNVAAVVYDWRTFTLQELLRHIKKALGPNGKVTSVAVIAPGNKPGSVALLEGCTTSAEKLAPGTGELVQFWRALAGCVAPNGVADGRRVDLLGCRVVEAPRDGASLLRELWRLTAVPFAAADDALGGYQLSTFMEEPSTGALSIISSTIRAIDIYFDRNALLGIEPPGAVPPDAGLLPPLPSGAYAPPLPAGMPPPGALMPLGGVNAGYGQQQVMGAGPGAPKDIFARFLEGARVQGFDLKDLFARHDIDKTGYLDSAELSKMVAQVLPTASELDVAHFKSMLDLDGNKQVTLAEFLTACEDNKKVASAVRSGRDETALMTTLHDYLTDNDQVFRNYFNEADVNKTGTLEHAEITGLVQQIPGLTLDEQKFIVSYLYQQDTTGKGALTFDQLKVVVSRYGTPAAQAALATPAPMPMQPQQPLMQAPGGYPLAPVANPYAAAPQPPAPGPGMYQQPAMQQPQAPIAGVMAPAPQFVGMVPLQQAPVGSTPMQAPAPGMAPAPMQAPAPGMAPAPMQPPAPMGAPAPMQAPMGTAPLAAPAPLPTQAPAPAGQLAPLSGAPALAPAPLGASSLPAAPGAMPAPAATPAPLAPAAAPGLPPAPGALPTPGAPPPSSLAPLPGAQVPGLQPAAPGAGLSSLSGAPAPAPGRLAPLGK